MCSYPFSDRLVDLLVLLVFVVLLEWNKSQSISVPTFQTFPEQKMLKHWTLLFSYLVFSSCLKPISCAERQRHHFRTSGLQCWKQNLGLHSQTLQNLAFLFWLCTFLWLMPHGECLLNIVKTEDLCFFKTFDCPGSAVIFWWIYKSLELPPSPRPGKALLKTALGLFHNLNVFLFFHRTVWITMNHHTELCDMPVFLVARISSCSGQSWFSIASQRGSTGIAESWHRAKGVPLCRPADTGGRYGCAERQALGGGGWWSPRYIGYIWIVSSCFIIYHQYHNQ